MQKKSLLQKQVNQVHVWRYAREEPVPSCSNDILSTEKIASGKGIVIKDRRHFDVMNFFLKKVLSHYLHLPVEEIRFDYGPCGKPSIKSEDDRKPLFFNLSHSGNDALLAISDVSHVGIDLEEVKPIEGLSRMALNYFSTQEQEILLKADEARERLLLFFKLWTMKEALIKSIGKDLLSFTAYNVVPFLKGATDCTDFDPHHLWQIKSIPFSNNHCAALAIRAENLTVKYFHFSEMVNKE